MPVGAAKLTFHHERGDVGGPRPSPTGDPVAVDEEEAVGHHIDIRKPSLEILVAKSVYSGLPALHQTALCQDESTGTDPDQRDLGGEIVELAETETLFADLQHAYTRNLLRLAPSLDRILQRQDTGEHA
ncbi:hypothetical protein [Labrys sp. KNU-23]|uniref:hypothetical protein n=1 Tax=Labrys sp. KNU-23 TaxID=2789216 RepID=UPI00165B86E2|nr:hypothetical protein [Labrys sp. KNU-23]